MSAGVLTTSGTALGRQRQSAHRRALHRSTLLNPCSSAPTSFEPGLVCASPRDGHHGATIIAAGFAGGRWSNAQRQSTCARCLHAKAHDEFRRITCAPSSVRWPRSESRTGDLLPALVVLRPQGAFSPRRASVRWRGGAPHVLHARPTDITRVGAQDLRFQDLDAPSTQSNRSVLRKTP